MYFNEVVRILSEDDTRHYRYTEFEDLPDNNKKEINGRASKPIYTSFKDLPKEVQNIINRQVDAFNKKLIAEKRQPLTPRVELSIKKDVQKYKEEITSKYCNYMKYIDKRNDTTFSLDNARKREYVSLYNLEQHKRVKQTRINKKNENLANNIIGNKDEGKSRLTDIVNNYPSVNKSSSNEEKEKFVKKITTQKSENEPLEYKVSKGNILLHYKNNTRPESLNDTRVLRNGFYDGKESDRKVDKKTGKKIGKKVFDDDDFKKEVIRVLNTSRLNPLIRSGDINNNNFQRLLNVVKAGSGFSTIPLRSLSTSEKIAKDSILQNINDKKSKEKPVAKNNYKQNENENKLFNTAALENEKTEEGYRMQQSSYFHKIKNLDQLKESLGNFAKNEGKVPMDNFYLIINAGHIQPKAHKDSVPLEDGRRTKGVDGIGCVNGKPFFVENKSSDVISTYSKEVSNFIQNCRNSRVMGIWNYSGSWNSTALKEFTDDKKWGLTIDKAKKVARLPKSKYDFTMMERNEFNDWLIENKIPSIKNYLKKPSDLDLIDKLLKDFLDTSKVRWEPGKRKSSLTNLANNIRNRK